LSNAFLVDALEDWRAQPDRRNVQRGDRYRVLGAGSHEANRCACQRLVLSFGPTPGAQVVKHAQDERIGLRQHRRLPGFGAEAARDGCRLSP
jgi:hypothetical protein